ncbi:MAG: hypothetical protein HWE27_05250 [Gammaproteobacteria bacterium]|nr:hypothetical protein [Gammaproteobacteria bacterium]
MDPVTAGLGSAVLPNLPSIGGGLDMGGGSIMPNSSATSGNGDYSANGPTIMGMTIGSPAASTVDKAIYAVAFVVFLIVVAALWKK